MTDRESIAGNRGACRPSIPSMRRALCQRASAEGHELYRRPCRVYRSSGSLRTARRRTVVQGPRFSTEGTQQRTDGSTRRHRVRTEPGSNRRKPRNRREVSEAKPTTHAGHGFHRSSSFCRSKTGERQPSTQETLRFLRFLLFHLLPSNSNKRRVGSTDREDPPATRERFVPFVDFCSISEQACGKAQRGSRGFPSLTFVQAPNGRVGKLSGSRGASSFRP